MTVDVDAIATDLVSGLIGIEEAESAIDGAEPLALDSPTHAEAIASEVGGLQRLVGRIFHSHSRQLVMDLGRLLVAGSERLGPLEAGWAHGSVGQQLMTLRAYEDAVGFFEIAEDEFRGRDNKLFLQAQVARLSCLVQLQRPEARSLVKAVIAMAEQTGEPLVGSTAMLESSRLFMASGDGRGALKVANEARALLRSICETSTDPETVSAFSNAAGAVGEAARMIGSIGEAISAFEEARTAAQAAGDPASGAWFLSEIGFTWQQAGEWERGAGSLRRAADEAQALGLDANAARWRGDRHAKLPLKDTEHPTVKFALALARFQAEPDSAGDVILDIRACISEARALGAKTFEAVLRNALGGVFVTAGRVQEAIMSLELAADMADDLSDRTLAFQFRTNLGVLLMERGRADDGERELTAAIERGESMRLEAQGSEFRQVVAAGLARAYEAMALGASAIYQLPGEQARQPQPRRAMDIGQRLRAINLNRSLRIGLAVEASASQPLVGAMLSLRAADIALESAALEGSDSLEPYLLRQERCSAQLTRTAADEGVDVQVEQPPLSLEELQHHLTTDECVVDLIAIEQGIAIVVCSATGEPTVELVAWRRPDRLQLVNQIRRVRRRAALDQVSAAGTNSDAAYLNLSDQLDAKLLVHIAEQIQQHGVFRRILVVPSGELFQVPFWQVTKWLPALVVSVIPSIAAVALLRQRKRPSLDNGTWLAVDDATGTLDFAARELESTERYQRCPPLAAAMIERFPGATRIHFSGHGYFDIRNPYRSGLVVSQDETQSPAESDLDRAVFRPAALFTVADIVGLLHLPKCNLAILSACDTGLPRQHAANEFTSLPAALLIAGARNVIASLWPAHDGAACLLMQELMTSLNEVAVAPSVALARARTRLGEMTRDEVLFRLGTDRFVPTGATPFASPIYADTFQHYGVD
jgi:CHAT domain-containing protein